MKRSLRFVVTVLMLLAITTSVTFAVFYSFETYNSTVSQIANNSTPALHAVRATLSSNMESAKQYLESVAYNSDIMDNLGSSADPTQLYSAVKVLHNAYSLLFTDHTIAGIIVYDSDSDIIHTVYGHLSGNTGFARVNLKNRIRDSVMALIQEDSLLLGEWSFMRVDNSYMMYNAVYWAGNYSVCLFDINAVVEEYTTLYDLPGKLVLAHDGECLTDTDNLEITDIVFADISDSTIYSGEEDILIVRNSGSIIDVYCLVPLGTLSSHFTTLQNLVLIIAFISVISLISTFLYLRVNFIRPMNDLMGSMEHIRAGNLDALPSSRYNSTEFRALNDTFISMIDSLHRMKIVAYEKDLENERIRLNALRLQIRPHFYLNCLKSIYASASLGNTEKVQKQILYLSTHLRYCFSDLGDTVPLCKELELCQNYMKMLSLDQQNPLILRLDISEELKNFQLPPMTVLTAVENSSKYYKSMDALDNQLNVYISARTLHIEDSCLVNITISDNGPGFSAAAMDSLAHPTAEHVGISNIVQQLRFHFGPKCEVAFTNHNGAQVDFFIPISKDGIV